MDTVFLTFANSQIEPLRFLKKEDDEVYGLLSRRAAQKHFSIHRDSYTSAKKIAEYLILHRESICLVLYSGHAAQEGLLVEEKMAYGQGIAQLLAQCPRLKAVILNGCSTEGQVAELLNQGVPAVIATSAPVNDDVATHFSISFFQALVEGYASLKEAYDAGIAAANIRKKDLNIHHNWKWKDIIAGKKTPLWGLAFHEEKKEVLDWKLPEQSMLFSPTNYEPNEQLIEKLLAALKRYSPEAKNIIEQEDMGAEVSILDKREAILKCLPHPISEQLRKLLVAESGGQGAVFYDKPGKPRLKQMANTYSTLIELLAFSMIAQLWDVMEEGENKGEFSALSDMLKRFFKLPPAERESYYFLPLIRNISQVFEERGISLYHRTRQAPSIA